MRDDPKFIEWLALQRQIFSLIIERRTVTTTEQYRAYNTAIDALGEQASPLWALLSVRYPPYELDRAARVLWQEVQ